MQRLSNTTPACASCKHQRKKCTDKCVLAPYFPVEKTREFQAVHRVFGVSNVTKLLVHTKEEDRRRAVESLIWEAMCRQKDPVLGPYGEYRKISEELRKYKNQYHQPQPNMHNLPISQAYTPVPTQGIMNNIHVNSYPCYGYSMYHNIQETHKENSSITLPPPQHFANNLNETYFITGTNQDSPILQ